jgi:hypothetical protein
LADGADVLVQLALDQEEVRLARNEFSRTLALFLLALWAALTAASWIQVRLGLRPLVRLQRELAALRHSAAERLSGVIRAKSRRSRRPFNELANAREATLGGRANGPPILRME